MANSLKIKVNGLTHGVSASLDTPLLYVLHNELHLHGPRFGCGLAQCGACSVLLDGKEIRSCVTPVAAVSGKSITTLEGLPAMWAAERGTTAAAPALHPLQQAWIDVQVPHCGYCQNGMMIQAADLLATTKNPTEDQIRTAMNGHLCRCGTYPRILTAIQQAAKVMAKGGDSDVTGYERARALAHEFLKAGGALIVGFSVLGAGVAGAASSAAADDQFASFGPADSNAIDSWIVMNADNTASVKLGKVELGQGSMTGLLMIAAEELERRHGQMHPITNDTDVTPNQGTPRAARRSAPAASRPAPPRRRRTRRSRARLDAARRAGREPHRGEGGRHRRRKNRDLRCSFSAASSSTSRWRRSTTSPRLSPRRVIRRRGSPRAARAPARASRRPRFCRCRRSCRRRAPAFRRALREPSRSGSTRSSGSRRGRTRWTSRQR